jgi:hypothetical protein
MTSEGKFHKRLMELDDSKDFWGGETITVEDIMKVVDEAKKEFPSAGYHTYDVGELLVAITNWFNKWFGDEKQ